MTNNNDNGFFKKKGTERKRLFLIIGAAVLLLTFIGIYSRREAIFPKPRTATDLSLPRSRSRLSKPIRSSGRA